MQIQEYAFFIVLALLAEILGTVSGFGSSILFVPIASLFFDFKIVLGVTAVFHVFSNLSKIALFRHGIDGRIALKLGLPAIVFVIAGALLTAAVSPETIEISMSFIVLALAVFMLINRNAQLTSSDGNLFLGGAVSGFLAGLVGTGGAIRGLTLAAFNLEKQIFVATSAVIDLGVDASRAIVYIFQGYFLNDHIQLIPMLILISIVGTWLGKLILERTSQNVFRNIVLGAIALASIAHLSKFIFR